MPAVSSEPCDNGALRTGQLVQRAQAGDRAAFEALYYTHVGRIYALCLRFAADVVRAEDLTQSVFVRAWEKLASYRAESAFSTWLHRLAVNLALEERRTEGRRTMRVMATGDDSMLERAGAYTSPDAGIDLERAISSLPEGARMVLVLHDIEGYRHEEIAELTGVAPGTCRAQLHRARRLLREALDA